MAEKDKAEIVAKHDIELLVEGKLPWEDVRRLLHVVPKEEDRFWKYMEVLQERWPWPEKILLRLTDHLYVVQKDRGIRIVKCDCGHEFGDYRINWKLSCLVYVRTTREEFAEVYTTQPVYPDPNYVEIREFYCPGCKTQLAVEAVPQGYPVIFEALPDLDSFYREWLNRPLKDERPDWFQDKTIEQVSAWAAEK